MPDISMCAGNNCELKDNCWRYKATPSYRQSWFATPPFESIFECDYFWEMEKHIIKE